MKSTILLFVFSFSAFCAWSQDFQIITVVDYSRSKQYSEDVNTGIVGNTAIRSSVQPDFTMAQSIGSNFFWKGDVSFVPWIAFSWLYDKEVTFDTGLFDFNFNKTFNPKRPLSIGPVDLHFGMGLGLGLKVFDSQGGTANAFLSYGLSFHSIVNITDNFQLFYLNTINLSYNPKYNEMGRTSHEFFFFYDCNWRIKPSIIPYIETFRFNETLANGTSFDRTFRYAGVRFGLTTTID